MKRPSEICSTTCARASSIPTRPSPSSAASRSPTSASPRVDHHRAIRSGLPEAIYGPGKTPEQCVAIVGELLAAGTRPVLLTRVDDDQADAVARRPPDRPSAPASTIVWNPLDRRRGPSTCSSSPPAPPTCPWPTSALRCSRPTASTPTRITDAGVAGVHRLLVHTDELAAPMSWWSSPGWRARSRASSAGSRPRRSSPCRRASATAPRFQGITALLAMLASCAAGVTVVGIDNGFGAACAALRLCNVHDRARSTLT